MDGSRLANAAAGLGCGLGELAGAVDVLSLGGTKNGMVLGEAVVFLDPGLAEGARYLRKQTLQLASKGRFLAAQFIAMFEGDLWRRNATHANAMAARLADAIAGVPGVTITQAVQANGVFAVLPARRPRTPCARAGRSCHVERGDAGGAADVLLGHDGRGGRRVRGGAGRGVSLSRVGVVSASESA